MALDYRIIKNDEYKTSLWTGGKTTELYIYPEGSFYEDRDFIFRLSSATIDVEESLFTSLPDYNRILLILKGKLLLKHDSQYCVELTELSQDTFDGAFNTSSVGKVTDFNLMMRKGKCHGKVEVLELEPKSTLGTIIHEEKHGDFSNRTDIYYNIKGEVQLSINESKKIVLQNKDLLIVNTKNENKSTLFEAYNSSDEQVEIINATVIH